MVSTKTVKVNISYWDAAVKENLHYVLIVLFHLEKYTSPLTDIFYYSIWFNNFLSPLFINHLTVFVGDVRFLLLL